MVVEGIKLFTQPYTTLCLSVFLVTEQNATQR